MSTKLQISKLAIGVIASVMMITSFTARADDDLATRTEPPTVCQANCAWFGVGPDTLIQYTVNDPNGQQVASGDATLQGHSSQYQIWDWCVTRMHQLCSDVFSVNNTCEYLSMWMGGDKTYINCH